MELPRMKTFHLKIPKFGKTLLKARLDMSDASCRFLINDTITKGDIMIIGDSLGEKFGSGHVFCPVSDGIVWKLWPGKTEGQERWLRFTCIKTLPAATYRITRAEIMPYLDYQFKWPEVPEDCDVLWKGEQQEDEVMRDSFVQCTSLTNGRNEWDYVRVLEYHVNFMASGDCKWSKDDIIKVLEHFNIHDMFTTVDCFREQKPIGSNQGKKRLKRLRA
jgi:hypothetical protein